jgi:hypothetical protein
MPGQHFHDPSAGFAMTYAKSPASHPDKLQVNGNVRTFASEGVRAVLYAVGTIALELINKDDSINGGIQCHRVDHFPASQHIYDTILFLAFTRKTPQNTITQKNRN